MKTLTCALPGSRVVGVIPPVDGFGDQGTQIGLAAGESMVFVADVVSIVDTPTSAPTPAPTSSSAPEQQTVEKDPSLTQPTVDLSTNPPTVTLPTAAPPASLDVQVVAEGTGEVVPAGANVTINYHGVNWASGVVFDSSYVRGAPATLSLGKVIPASGRRSPGRRSGRRSSSRSRRISHTARTRAIRRRPARSSSSSRSSRSPSAASLIRCDAS